MATPANPRVYMHDDMSSLQDDGIFPGVAFQNFYHWDGHGTVASGIGRARGDATRGFAFQGESSSGVFGWTIIDLETLVAITSATVATTFNHDMHGLTQALALAYFKESVSGVVHVSLETDSSNHILARNGSGVLLGTSDYMLPPSAAGGGGPTYHIEGKLVVHGSAGSIVVKVDDVEVLNLQNQNTRNGGTGVVGYVEWHCEGSRRTSEVSVHDGSAFLGSQWRSAYVPVASVGTYTSGTAFPSGTKLEAVNDDPESAEDELDGYAVLDDTGLAKKLSFVSGPMPALALAIRDIHAQMIVRKSDGGVNTAKLGLRSGSTESYNATALAVPDAFVARRLPFRRDITSGNPLWTLVTAAAVEIIAERDT